ncbi:sensor histidine kinase [Nitrosopumilus sp.]|uniref:sensor histidine kinase n=1 Tax=Nitrosopumilus sp. TaxID=2024843 RepID=UPI003D12ED6D
MKFELTYSKKLLFLLLLVSLVPLVVLSTFYYVDKIETESNTLKNKLSSVSETGSKNISEKLYELKDNISQIAQTEIIVTSTKELSNENLEKSDIFKNRYELENQFYILSDSFPEVQSFTISNAKTGKILFYTDLVPPIADLKNQKHFEQSIKENIQTSEVLLSAYLLPNEFGNYELNIPTLYVSSPIEGEAGIEGILTVRANLFKTILISQSDDFVTSNSYLVTSEGYFLSKPKYFDDSVGSDFINTRPELNYQAIEPNTNQFTEILKISNNETTELNLNGYSNYLGAIVVGSVSPVKETGWSYVAEVDKNEAFQKIISFQILTVSIFGIVLIGMVSMALYFASTFTSPIKKLQNATEQIIQGNFDIKTAENSRDDIGQLTRNFQNMVQTLKDTTDVKEQITIQQNLRKALEESSTVSIIDKNGKITYVNERFCKASKYTKNELIGKRQDILRSRKIHLPGFYKDLWTTISSGKIWHGEICNTAKDGTLFWNDTTIIPFLDKDGQISEYVSIRNDITEQKNLTDRLVRAERFSAIGELSARISHDIRNPLAIIKSEFELLKIQKQIDEEDFRRIDTSINRITHQLDDVLEYLRDTPLVYSKFNLTELVTEVIDTLQVPSNVKITIKDDEIFMIGDKEKMNVILVNLIFNSIQALEDGGNIEIILSKIDSKIVIQIQDSGIGITIKPIEAIFDPLTTSKQKGTGLGLASVKNLVEQHGGTISVKNNPTTFTINIPQKEGEI